MEDKDNYVVGALQNLLQTVPDVTEEQVKNTNFGHIIAGVITTTSTLYCMFNILLHHPGIYRRLQKEITDVIGDRHVQLGDRERMPYLMAIVNETLRYASITPVFPRRTTKDTELSGRHVPKETMVLVNPWSIHHNPHIYPQPWVFDPERFLDAEGKLVLADHPARRNIYAFGAGSRSCFGEVLAKSRIFIMATTMLQKFEYKFGCVESSCDPREYQPGLPMICKPFTVLATRR